MISEFQPRGWQETAFSKWTTCGYKGVFSVVTGGGKSIFGMMCIREVFQKKLADKALIVVPTLTLQDQWQINIADFFGVKVEDVSIWRTSKHIERKINICVINSLSKIKVQDIEEYILVADECHRYASSSFYSGINYPWKFSVGLSATPQREYDNYFEERLVPVLGKILYEYSYYEAMEDSVINNYDLINIECPLSSSEESEYQELSKSIGKAWATGNEDRAKILAIKRSRIANESDSRILGGLASIKSIKSGPTIIFFETIDFAKRFSLILDELSIGHVIYFSGQSNSLRQQSLFAFKEGYYQFLLACKALDEGLDIPSIENAIIVSGSSTKRQRIQRVGRALRKKNGKDRSKVFTLYSVESEYERLIEESLDLPESVEVKWLSVNE